MRPYRVDQLFNTSWYPLGAVIAMTEGQALNITREKWPERKSARFRALEIDFDLYNKIIRAKGDIELIRVAGVEPFTR